MLFAVLADDSLPPLLQSIGRLHPIGVHLPLGLVAGAFIVEVVRMVQRRHEPSSFTAVAMGLAALGAIGACTSGWLFAENEGSGGDLFWHRWLGIAAALLLSGVAWTAWRALRPGRSAAQLVPIVRAGVIVCAGLAAWVGHLGGNMVWGSNFVLEPLMKARATVRGVPPAPGAPPAPTSPTAPAAPTAPGAPTAMSSATLYATTVLPILVDHCYECHGNGKHKGGLRLDDPASTLAQDENDRWIVKAGEPEASTLLARVLLPAEDDDAMPPKGERLTTPQVDALRAWIASGASMATPDAEAERATAGGHFAPDAANAPAGLAPLAPEVLAQALALRGRGIVVSPVTVDSILLEVSIPGAGTFTDADLAALSPYAAHVARLSLARTGITDAGMAAAPDFPAVRALRLDQTALTDRGIAGIIERTPAAEVVNLVGTAATDASLEALGTLTALRRVYVWNTRISAVGIDAFRVQHPTVEVVVGQLMAGTSQSEGPPP